MSDDRMNHTHVNDADKALTDEQVREIQREYARLENLFGYHSATADTVPKHQRMREKYLGLAADILATLPEGSRERSLALTELESSLMWVNKAIAVHGSPLTLGE